MPIARLEVQGAQTPRRDPRSALQLAIRPMGRRAVVMANAERRPVAVAGHGTIQEIEQGRHRGRSLPVASTRHRPTPGCYGEHVVPPRREEPDDPGPVDRSVHRRHARRFHGPGPGRRPGPLLPRPASQGPARAHDRHHLGRGDRRWRHRCPAHHGLGAPRVLRRARRRPADVGDRAQRQEPDRGARRRVPRDRAGQAGARLHALDRRLPTFSRSRSRRRSVASAASCRSCRWARRRRCRGASRCRRWPPPHSPAVPAATCRCTHRCSTRSSSTSSRSR